MPISGSDVVSCLVWTLPLAGAYCALALLRQTHYSQLQADGQLPSAALLSNVSAQAAIIATHLQSMRRNVKHTNKMSQDDLRIFYVLASLRNSYNYGIWLYGILPAAVTKIGSALAV
jgi:hypothetical protein